MRLVGLSHFKTVFSQNETVKSQNDTDLYHFEMEKLYIFL